MTDAPLNRYHAIFSGKYGRIDPADGSAQPRILWDQDQKSADTEVEVAQDGDRMQTRFVQRNVLICYLGAPDAPIGSYVRCFETRPAEAWGASESPWIVTYPNGLIGASVEYVSGEKHWFSAQLLLEK